MSTPRASSTHLVLIPSYNPGSKVDETVVRAPHEGLVTGLSILSGETVAPNQSIFTLIAEAGAGHRLPVGLQGRMWRNW